MSFKYLIFDAAECYCKRKFQFSKTEAESGKLFLDFSSQLMDGVFLESLASTVVVTDRRTGEDVTASIVTGPIEDELDLDGNIVGVGIPFEGGIKGHSYKMSVIVPLDDGYSKAERFVQFNVLPE